MHQPLEAIILFFLLSGFSIGINGDDGHHVLMINLVIMKYDDDDDDGDDDDDWQNHAMVIGHDIDLELIIGYLYTKAEYY